MLGVVHEPKLALPILIPLETLLIRNMLFPPRVHSPSSDVTWPFSVLSANAFVRIDELYEQLRTPQTVK